MNWYLDYIKKELDYAVKDKFSGNLQFKVNFLEGGIGHINVSVNQSVKMPKEAECQDQSQKQSVG